MKKIILVLLSVILVFVISCVEEKPDDSVVSQPNEQKDIEDKEQGFAGITKKQCIEAGGKWNECGSPCAGTGAEMCIQMCQVQCECNAKEFTCPEGYKCRLSGKIISVGGRIIDEIGVCVEE